MVRYIRECKQFEEKVLSAGTGEGRVFLRHLIGARERAEKYRKFYNEGWRALIENILSEEMRWRKWATEEPGSRVFIYSLKQQPPPLALRDKYIRHSSRAAFEKWVLIWIALSLLSAKIPSTVFFVHLSTISRLCREWKKRNWKITSINDFTRKYLRSVNTNTIATLISIKLIFYIPYQFSFT